MALPAVLLVLVLTPAPPASAASAFERAARGLLEPEIDLRIAMLRTLPSDEMAVEQAQNAAGLVEMSWDDAHRRVSLHCYVQANERWVDRTIAFDATDRESERGRLVGFTVASMFSNASGLDDGSVPQTAAASKAMETSSLASATASASDTRDGITPRQQPLALSTSARSLEFAGIAANGIGGQGAGMGASFAARLPLSEALSGRVVLGARLGEVPAAQASTRTVLVGLGLVWSVLPNHDPLDLGLRADALGGWLQVSHFSEDDIVPAHEHRWLAGGDALVTVAYSVSTLASLYVGSGIEAMLGPTALYTHGRQVGAVPVLRAVAELGVRTNF
jgi:hypothetical protein